MHFANKAEDLLEKNLSEKKNPKLSMQSNHRPSRPSISFYQMNLETKSKMKKLVMFTFIFMLIELFGGWWSNSVAIISDALHMGADTIGYSIQLFSVYLASWQATNTYTFGFKRGEVVGGLLNCLIIWVLTLYLIGEAIARIISPPERFDRPMMLITAILGVLLNLSMGGVLIGFNNIHRILKFWENDTDQNNHDDADYNIRITVTHIRGDMCYSLGVLLSSIVINCYPKWLIVDSLCTILFSVVVVHITHPIITSVTRFIFEAVPEGWLKRV